MEYAAFFGSTKITKYLQSEGVKITPSLWLYAIHSQKAWLIHFLEDCRVEPPVTTGGAEEESYIDCFWESIKCNHNGIADYFFNNYIQNGDQISSETFIQSLKYYNFEFLQKEHVNDSSFCCLCENDYYLFVDYLQQSKGININDKIILIHIFQWNSKSYLSIQFKIISFNSKSYLSIQVKSYSFFLIYTDNMDDLLTKKDLKYQVQLKSSLIEMICFCNATEWFNILITFELKYLSKAFKSFFATVNGIIKCSLLKLLNTKKKKL